MLTQAFRGVQNFPSRPVPSQGILGREIFVPKIFGTGQNFSSGRDGTWDGVVPILSRPEYKYMCIYIIFLEKCMCYIYHVWVYMTFF